ncbi:MAG: hypothetical protein DHS20C01_00160 [marine bacterium B5-7]|nr:MAG: hypothetical protein DHS20C01_00160 [marine bacterium B5-7]
MAQSNEISTSIESQPEDNQYRAGAYSLLAALLRSEPDTALLERASAFAESFAGDELGASLATLGAASKAVKQEDVKHEYFSLFIGIGRGELLPYGSWYLTGFLMERPLGELRSDLAQLGFERQATNKEPEDHVAALCEVMSMLASEPDSFEMQRTFFTRHMAPWLSRFFNDLGKAKNASYYQAVARFGTAFTAFEEDYMGMQV